MKELPPVIKPGQSITALAPMQDVTNLAFMRVLARYGAPDYFFTEYFRVHDHSRLEKAILSSITENPTDRPVFAQLIGESLVDLERTVNDLKNYPIAGIDLNMGCPAPKVYKKNVGGGLLRDLGKVDQILALLREVSPTLFTVKTRIGFEDTSNFEGLLELINKYNVDLFSLHGRTVKEMYRSEVHYDYIRRACEVVKCPVLANGNITSAKKAEWTLDFTGAAGVMVGRSAIRNPWIFRQIREHFSGKEIFQPRLGDVNDYIHILYDATDKPGLPEKFQINYMKKFLNFVGQGVDPESRFLKAMRRAQSKEDLFKICKEHLLDNGLAEKDFGAEPYEGVIARPNCETPLTCESFKG